VLDANLPDDITNTRRIAAVICAARPWTAAGLVRLAAGPPRSAAVGNQK
jgi:hypothetical protein